MFIFEFGEISTICGSKISSAEVWIKVCNSHSKSLNGAFKSGAEAPLCSLRNE
jgi:hypothetical protein